MKSLKIVPVTIRYVCMNVTIKETEVDTEFAAVFSRSTKEKQLQQSQELIITSPGKEIA